MSDQSGSYSPQSGDLTPDDLTPDPGLAQLEPAGLALPRSKRDNAPLTHKDADRLRAAIDRVSRPKTTLDSITHLIEFIVAAGVLCFVMWLLFTH